jgi:DNA-directed RNA polymerase specialized sigma24 family protein
MNQETVTLIQQAQTGDTNAFFKLVELYDWQITANMLQFIRQDDQLESVYQTLFNTAHDKLHEFRFDRDFYVWLYPILFKIIFDTPNTEPINSKQDQPLDLLSHQERLIFILIHNDKFSFKDVAIILKRTKNFVRSTFCSAVEKLHSNTVRDET